MSFFDNSIPSARVTTTVAGADRAGAAGFEPKAGSMRSAASAASGPARAQPADRPEPRPALGERQVSSTAPPGPLRLGFWQGRAMRNFQREHGRLVKALAAAPGRDDPATRKTLAAHARSFARGHAKLVANGVPAREIEARCFASVHDASPEALADFTAAMAGDAFGVLQDALAHDDDALRLMLGLLDTAHHALLADGRARIADDLARLLEGSASKSSLADEQSPLAAALSMARRAHEDLHERLGVVGASAAERADRSVLVALCRAAPSRCHELLESAWSRDLGRLRRAIDPSDTDHAAITELLHHAADSKTDKLVEVAAFRAERWAASLAPPAAGSSSPLLPAADAPDAGPASRPRLDPTMPGGLATAHARLVSAERSFDSARAHLDHHQLPPDPRLQAAAQTLRDGALALVQQASTALNRMSAEDLLALAAIADRHGIDAPTVKLEAVRRHELMAARFDRTLLATLAGLRDRDPAAALEALARLQDEAAALRALGAAAWGGRPGIDDVEVLVGQCLARTDDGLRRAAADALTGDFGRDLAAALGAAGAVDQPTEAARARVARAALVLERLPHQLARGAGGADDGRIGHASSGAIPVPGDTIPREIEQAVAARFGVRVPESVAGTRRGFFDGEFRATMLHEFQKPLSEKERKRVTLPNGLEVGEQFRKDAPRNTDFRLPDGRPLMPLVRPGEAHPDEDEIDRRLGTGMQELVDLFGGDREAVAVLTAQAAQTGLAPFALAFGLLTDDDANPARLDGRPGNPTLPSWSSAETRTVTFLEGPNGKPCLRFDFELRGGALTMADGTQVVLDRERSVARMGVLLELVDLESGQLRPVGAPSYELHLVRDGFQKSYPPPTHASAILGTHGSHDAREDFERHLAGAGLGGRQVGVAQAMARFAEHPDVETLEQIAAAVGAAPEDTPPQATLDQIRNVFEQRKAVASRELLASFDPVVGEISATIGREFYSTTAPSWMTTLPGWPEGYRPPASYEDLLREQNAAAINTFHASVKKTPLGRQLGEFLDGLDALHQAPNLAGARELLERIPSQLVEGLTAAARETRGRIDDLAARPLDATLFAPRQAELTHWLDDALPEFAASVRRGENV